MLLLNLNLWNLAVVLRTGSILHSASHRKAFYVNFNTLSVFQFFYNAVCVHFFVMVNAKLYDLGLMNRIEAFTLPVCRDFSHTILLGCASFQLISMHAADMLQMTDVYHLLIVKNSELVIVWYLRLKRVELSLLVR